MNRFYCIGFELMLAIVVLTGCASSSHAAEMPDPERPDAPKMTEKPTADYYWIAPRVDHEYADGTYKKKDLLKSVMDDRVWDGPGLNPTVFKSYMSLVGKAKVDGKVRDNCSDAELEKLATYLKHKKIKIAFEIGGVRVTGKYGPEDAGKYFREVEAPRLRDRWIALGGELHYLTTDHMTMAIAGTHHGKTTDVAKFDPDRVLEVCADTLQAMHEEFPGVAIGLTESLGYFNIKSKDGVHYRKLRQDIPDFSFIDWIHPLVERCGKRGFKLDHYHVDYSLSAMGRDFKYAFPDRPKPGIYEIPDSRDVHLGRVRHCLDQAERAGLKTGFLLTGGRHAHRPLGEGSDEETWKVISTVFESLAASGLRFDHFCLQSWQKFPLETGLDAGGYSFMANALKLAQNPSLAGMQREHSDRADR